MGIAESTSSNNMLNNLDQNSQENILFTDRKVRNEYLKYCSKKSNKINNIAIKSSNNKGLPQSENIELENQLEK